MVALFAIFIYLFVQGAQQMGLPTIANIAIFVIISGIFAWLVKRLTDIISGLSRRWFPETDEDNSTTWPDFARLTLYLVESQ